MFQRIIVAFDGSPRSEDALALALRLRDPADGILTLACCVTQRAWHLPAHDRRPATEIPEDVARMFAEARARVPSGTPTRERAPVAASVARGLTELAEAEAADLVVVGSSRRAQPGRVWIERTAGRLLQGAPCAVAVAPAGVRETERFRHVGVAYDASPEARAALEAAYRIASSCGSAVTVMLAVPESAPLVPAVGAVSIQADELRARLHLQEVLEDAAGSAPEGVNPRALLLDGPPARAITAACEGVVDLLVTGSRGYGPMQRALLGSVSEALVDSATQPVVVLPRRPHGEPDRPAPAGATTAVETR